MAINTTQAIEALHCMRDRERWNDFSDVTIGDTVQRMFYMGVLEMAIDALKKQQWIPCSTALPKDEEEVIVSIHDDSGDCAYDYSSSGWYAAAGEFWVVDNEANSRVVAWMPLPKPWEGYEN